MIRLSRSVAAWGTDAFCDTLKSEVRALAPGDLPLHRLSGTGHALESGVSVTLIGVRDTAASIEVRLGVFFEELLPGCSCGDEPEPQPGYGELWISIDKASALARFDPIERPPT